MSGGGTVDGLASPVSFTLRSWQTILWMWWEGQHSGLCRLSCYLISFARSGAMGFGHMILSNRYWVVRLGVVLLTARKVSRHRLGVFLRWVAKVVGL